MAYSSRVQFSHLIGSSDQLSDWSKDNYVAVWFRFEVMDNSALLIHSVSVSIIWVVPVTGGYIYPQGNIAEYVFLQQLSGLCQWWLVKLFFLWLAWDRLNIYFYGLELTNRKKDPCRQPWWSLSTIQSVDIKLMFALTVWSGYFSTRK